MSISIQKDNHVYTQDIITPTQGWNDQLYLFVFWFQSDLPSDMIWVIFLVLTFLTNLKGAKMKSLHSAFDDYEGPPSRILLFGFIIWPMKDLPRDKHMGEIMDRNEFLTEETRGLHVRRHSVLK